MNVGFAVNSGIKKLVQPDKVLCDEVKTFKQGAQNLIEAFRKMPCWISYPLVLQHF